METPGAFQSAPGAGAQTVDEGPASDARETSWRGAIDRTLAGLGAVAVSRLRVLQLEAQRAMQVSASAVAMAAVALLLLVTAWFALVAAIVVWAVMASFQWPWVLLSVAVVCALLGWLGVAAARRSFSTIRFDATARVFRRSPASAAATSSGDA